MKKLLCALCVLCASALNVFAQYEAETDTNGNFLWPPTIPSGQVTAWATSSITGGGSAGSWTIQTNGYFTFIGADGSTVVHNAAGFAFYDSNGNNYAFTNRIVWVNGSSYFQVIITNMTTAVITNIPALSNLLAFATSLSNQMYAAFSASNTVYQNAFNASNSVTLAALAATNSYTSNALAQIINTNSINLTNWIALQGFFQTNNVTNAAGITFANGSNYAAAVAYAIGANATNAFGAYGGTNYFSTHYRVGTVTLNAGTTNATVTLSPGFADPSYSVWLQNSTPNVQNTVIGVNAWPVTYNTFSVIIPGGNAFFNMTYNYVAYHP